ncbi:hypothetical protein I3843_03G179500 [Carya illinoinensis]|uniref:Uncharacterized protein n=1 Tax=Carya illinoinensis TaxID=32201 RepID=A0A922FMD3_CARIL|nr:hypothetical protein I3760_03G178300 [Carya illinoinensis]KAG6722771.1 hypothetical protein I3842_03G177300 [Carya illinoinensis]KAG7988270.1 hypothetical protein I3843_03G179500 [Carya illinoinensis]
MADTTTIRAMFFLFCFSVFLVNPQARILHGHSAMQRNIDSQYLWQIFGFDLSKHENYRRLATTSGPETDRRVPGGPDRGHHS